MNAAQPESERRTRRERVDPLLKASGWEIIPLEAGLAIKSLTAHAVTEFPTANGPADYALVSNGQMLGIVEAKKVTVGPQGVLPQAERYAKGLQDSPFDYGGLRVPFLYSTNGEVIWFRDARSQLNAARQLKAFHTPGALSEFLQRNLHEACARLGELPNDHPRLRGYQIEANQAIERAISARRRLMLVAMATGTGKTFTMVNEVYRLMKSGVGLRVLFLVDRRALAAQAVRAFASFEPEPNKKFDQIYEVYSQRFHREDFDEKEGFDPKVMPNSYLTDPKPKHAFVYVSTIQRMAINLFGRQAVWLNDGEPIDDAADTLNIPIHAFDLIIADECHRGYTTAELSLWRNTLDHFDAIKIGLTATPAHHTTAYFREVVFRYEYERAVREGFLVDYDVVSIKSNVRLNGLFLKEDEHVEIVDPETGATKLDQLEDERAFATEEVERAVTSPDSNRKIIAEMKKYALEHEQAHGRFPKTLIFAVNDLPHTSHADQLAGLAVEAFGKGEQFVRKITGRVDRPLQAIREFRNRPNPGVVVTVDLLSTGVDIPDLEFIVFLRPVKSRILFEQMLGRGTRKGEKFPDKSHFVVLDCFDGTLIQYFRNSTGMTEEPPLKPARTSKEIIDDIWKNVDREYNTRCLVKRLQRTDKEMAGEARAMFEAQGIPDGDVAQFAAHLPLKLKEDFKGTMALLRSTPLLELLENYPKQKKAFLRAIESEDEVSSQWLVKDGEGRELKPEDYLALFRKFVKENPAHIEAIRILLDRPRGWGTGALSELKNKFAAAPERFTIENLQKAHKIRYNKALADIISMVKHAAKEQEPLLTAGERVDRALQKVTAGRTLTEEQHRWLGRIREHLIANLSIEREDFELLPIFSAAGGWVPADRAFDGELESLIKSLNEAIAA